MTQSTDGTQSADRIDSKYEVLSELVREGHLTLYSVAVQGQPAPLRLGWFAVSSSAQRSSFHRYRSALKALAPAGLLDVVARPGAYYTVWKPLEGQPLSAFLALPVRGELPVQALRDLATGLTEQGYALTDAEVVFTEAENGQVEPQIGYLVPAERTFDEAAALNAQVLAPLKKGRLRRHRPALSAWAVLPGLLFLGGAGYLGAQAARIYLNPPVHEVGSVLGKPAETGARTLASAGFRVVYADGEGPGQPVGTVIAQDPPAGTSLPAGRQVTLTVNNPPPLQVPKLDDLSADQVAVALAENRLTRGQVLTVDGTFSNTPKGRVIAQLPAAGATAQRGDAVTLLVSGGVGSKQTWLPPLTGLSFDDARDLVRRAGLVITSVKQQDSSARENTVLTQSPAPYAKVDSGSPVTLTVATVGFTGPSQSAGNLPLPPPVYVAPTVPTPADPVPTDPLPATDQGGAVPGATVPETGQQGAGQTGTAGQTTPAQTSAAQTNAGQTNAGQTNTGQANAGQTTGQAGTTQPVTPQTNTTIPATPPTPAVQARSVTLSYAFPADLPSGNVDIVVRDLDGERTVLGNTPSSSAAGASAQQDGIQVRGDATFIVRVNGQEFTSFPAR
ncbi:PASTA domain-containing protein [Deinococcus altitudinis]|uniref:PASTA domain-containing protein n=1 Tax=Deinococcus altitudinis TaxID=468914 RepID=UPI0038929969